MVVVVDSPQCNTQSISHIKIELSGVHLHAHFNSFFFFPSLTPVCRHEDVATCTRRLTEGGWKRGISTEFNWISVREREKEQRNGFSKPFKMLRKALVYTKWYQDFPYYRLESLLITSACRARHVRCSMLPSTIGRHSYRFFIPRLWTEEIQVLSLWMTVLIYRQMSQHEPSSTIYRPYRFTYQLLHVFSHLACCPTCAECPPTQRQLI